MAHCDGGVQMKTCAGGTATTTSTLQYMRNHKIDRILHFGGTRISNCECVGRGKEMHSISLSRSQWSKEIKTEAACDICDWSTVTFWAYLDLISIGNNLFLSRTYLSKIVLHTISGTLLYVGMWGAAKVLIADNLFMARNGTITIVILSCWWWSVRVRTFCSRF